MENDPMDDPFRRPTFRPAISYRDQEAAMNWLEKAFGFERSMVISDKEGRLAHVQMRFDDGVVILESEWADFTASPASIGGKNTQAIHVYVREEIEAHCQRARAAGAEILMEPTDQFYGDRTYRARDLEGHVWTFGQSVRKVSREEAEEETGFKIEGWR
jgi:uncharacterized glyoxalase superfamily protein PhnB